MYVCMCVVAQISLVYQGRVERLKYAQYRRLRHHAANGVQVLAYIRSCRDARSARGAAARVIQRRFKALTAHRRFVRQKVCFYRFIDSRNMTTACRVAALPHSWLCTLCVSGRLRTADQLV